MVSGLRPLLFLMKEYMDKATGTNKAAKFREMAKDKSLPQDVRNAYLDKANAIEKEAAKPTMAKGGSVAPKKMAKGGAAKKPEVAIMIAVGKPKGKAAMAKGGMTKGKC